MVGAELIGAKGIGRTIPDAPNTRRGGETGVEELDLNADAPVTAGGTANAATSPQLSDQLREENLANIARQDGRLARALSGQGNFPIGTGSRADADRLGRIFVGDGARPLSDGNGLISADGSRVYRYPQAKPNTPRHFAPTGVQANFQIRDPNTGETLSNGHLNITGN